MSNRPDLISIHALLAESDGHRAGRDRYQNYFYPRSPCGERRYSRGCRNSWASQFLSTLSLRRATWHESKRREIGSHFYPRSPCGERHLFHIFLINSYLFLSTLSLRRATSLMGSIVHSKMNFYPRSPCGERLLFFLWLQCPRDFYPRSPCGERRSLK